MARIIDWIDRDEDSCGTYSIGCIRRGGQCEPFKEHRRTINGHCRDCKCVVYVYDSDMVPLEAPVNILEV